MPEVAIPDPVRITDTGDGRVDDYRRLADARARRRMEAPAGGLGFFVAEGVHAVRRLLLSGHRVRSVLVDPIRLESLAADLPGITAPVYVAERPVLLAVAGFDVHRGALAAAERWPLPDPAALLPAARRVAVLEGINDHENLGVIFRNAAGLKHNHNDNINNKADLFLRKRWSVGQDAPSASDGGIVRPQDRWKRGRMHGTGRARPTPRPVPRRGFGCTKPRHARFRANKTSGGYSRTGTAGFRPASTTSTIPATMSTAAG